MIWTLKKLKRFGPSLLGSLKLLSPLLPDLLPLLSSFKSVGMRRVISFAAGYISVSYQDNGKEIGHLHYNLFDGIFTIVQWPKSFSALVKIVEYLKVLGYARKLVKDEKI